MAVFKLIYSHFKTIFVLIFLLVPIAHAADTLLPTTPPPTPNPNYHLVGWTNAILPGGGQLLYGNYWQAGFEALYETSSFYLGYRLSNGDVFSLDGFEAPRPGLRNRKLGVISMEDQLGGNMIQEFGIKAHMVNVFNNYRDAALKNGAQNSWIDQTPTVDLFMKPFDKNVISDNWVWIPIAAVALSSGIDYYLQTKDSIAQTNRLTPTSNVMYAFNYSVWQSFGSGAPEEMFYRGFMQNEFQTMTSSPLAAIALTTVAFSFSHEPGDGRYTAAIAGSYLGYLAYRNHGNLGPGIAVHFWSEVILGIENFLLNHKGQTSSPPGGFSVQLPF